MRFGLDADTILEHKAIVALDPADAALAARLAIVRVADVVDPTAIVLQDLFSYCSAKRAPSRTTSV